MSRRPLVPLLVLAVLTVLALGLAVLGFNSSPDRPSLAVQNATARTFGAPPGTVPFTVNVIDTLSTVRGTGALSQVRHAVYTIPSRLVVTQRVGRRTSRVAVLGPSATPCLLASYTADSGGSTAWLSQGNDTYTRTESLAEYSSRVPRSSGTSCAPQPTDVRGTVAERAVLRAGYLVDLALTVTVPPQRLPNGQSASSGIEGEQLQLVSIGGTPVGKLGS
jgi:hypothetical protein